MMRYRNILMFILCSLLGFSGTFFIPALSHDASLLRQTTLETTQVEQNDLNSTTLLAQAEIEPNPDILAIAREGQDRYDAGQFGEAIKLWQQAAEAYQEVGDEEGFFKSQINKAQALQNLGLYPRACKTLLQAFAVEQPDCSSEQVDLLVSQFSNNSNTLSLNQAIGFRSLGDVLRRQGQLADSQTALQISLSKAQASSEEAATQLSLGNTERALGLQARSRWNYEQITEIIASQSQSDALEPDISAIQSYKQVETISSAPLITNIQAQLNHLSLLTDIQKWWTEQANRRISSWSRTNDYRLIQRAEGFLSLLNQKLNSEIAALQNTIGSNINNLALNRKAVSAQINLAHNYLQLSQIAEVKPLLTTALEKARSLQYKEGESYALGYLGKMYYEQWQQLERARQQSSQGETLLREATLMTQQALLLASDTSEISYLWQSQLGNLLKEQGNIKGAISSYFAAFNTLQSIRTDLNENNQDLRFDFRQEIQFVYKSLADLLLKSDLSPEELESAIV